MKCCRSRSLTCPCHCRRRSRNRPRRSPKPSRGASRLASRIRCTRTRNQHLVKKVFPHWYEWKEAGVRGLPSPFINLDERGRETPPPSLLPLLPRKGFLDEGLVVDRYAGSVSEYAVLTPAHRGPLHLHSYGTLLCPAQRPFPIYAISASSPMSTPARRRPPSASCTTPGASTPSSTFTIPRI